MAGLVSNNSTTKQYFSASDITDTYYQFNISTAYISYEDTKYSSSKLRTLFLVDDSTRKILAVNNKTGFSRLSKNFNTDFNDDSKVKVLEGSDILLYKTDVKMKDKEFRNVIRIKYDVARLLKYTT